VTVPVTCTEQEAPERVQVVPVGKVIVPVPPLWENVIISPLIVPTYPLTVAVQVCPVQVTVVVVTAG
jgi:hypothetical protein